jgi:hypothetical protein
VLKQGLMGDTKVAGGQVEADTPCVRLLNENLVT